MDRRQRIALCIVLQVMTAWVMLCMQDLQHGWRRPGARAEVVFSAEIARETETPAPTLAPEPSGKAAAGPEETPQPPADMIFRVEVIRTTPEPKPWAGKRVLIYHSHTWEAYEQVPDTPYRETERWRTRDEGCNMLAVGEALAVHLTALGINVVHDRTAFEPPNLDGAYARSLAMLEARLAAGESYDLYIDLHRDALADTSTIRRTVETPGGTSARFMVLIGKGTTGGYAEKPDWEANLALARRITDSLNAQVEGIARDVKIKTGRFNQHIAPNCVLIECGVNTNTLQQVLTGLPYLARAIAEALE